MSFVDAVLDGVDSLMAWVSTSLKQTATSYCELETADDAHTLVSQNGSLISLIRIDGITELLGVEEFIRVHEGITGSLQSNMSSPGHAFQMWFSSSQENAQDEIRDVMAPAINTAQKLKLDLDDLFKERVDFLSRYCVVESVFLVIWTYPNSLSSEQNSRAMKEKLKLLRKNKSPPMMNVQNVIAAVPDLRNSHGSFVRSVESDLNSLSVRAKLLGVHEALREVRKSVDPDFTDKDWRPVLPGDFIPTKVLKRTAGEISGLLWPSLARQLIPRDAENIDLRTTRIGDKIYSSVFIDLFPQDIKPFAMLFKRVLDKNIPWRMSYQVDSDGLSSIRFKSVLAKILSWTSSENKLIDNANNYLRNIEVGSDDSVVRLRVAFSTWAPSDDVRLLRARTAELARAIEGWGTCEVSEISGDPFGGTMSSALGLTTNSHATSTIAPLSRVISMLPITRPASSWTHGAILFRSPGLKGKLWPYQPGSSQQTTWIDLIYARPGSGKSVLSNAINLALCLSPGIQQLPRIGIIDIGPSSSGLISLLREALPREQRHLAAYHRLTMTPRHSINPFDTQLGCRFPTAQERAFLVNFLTLLATPIGADRSYDGVPDMSGKIVDELYKQYSDDGKPNPYVSNVDPALDGLLHEINMKADVKTTWWEVVDALFDAGFKHEAGLAQRHAVPLLSDVTEICRTNVMEDLYGKIRVSTQEPLITAYARMISSAVREYPILSKITSFDLGESRVISLDLDEVAKSGGDAADRQTAVTYMLSRYVLGRNYYVSEESIQDMPSRYRPYHSERVAGIKEDQKRLVYDEFHRTSKARAVREQVIVDMREGRKHNVQVALISQSLDDFEKNMVDFATSTFIMDAGPAQSIQRTKEVFGLTPTAELALKNRVHGPGEGGATFLAQFATKSGMNTQLLTNTVGPVELWAFSTTTEDATLRNMLYQNKSIGAKETRRLLATLFPRGSVKALIEERLTRVKEEKGMIMDTDTSSAIQQLYEEIVAAYAKNPQIQRLS